MFSLGDSNFAIHNDKGHVMAKGLVVTTLQSLLLKKKKLFSGPDRSVIALDIG